MYFLQNVTSQLSQSLSPLQDIARALHDADKTNSDLVLATAVLAISSIVIGALSLWLTHWQVGRSEKRQEVRFTIQSKIQDDEHFERVRPWVVIEAPKPWQVVYEDNSSVPYDVYIKIPIDERKPVKTISLALLYSNKGQRVAKSLKNISHSSFQQFPRTEFENMSEEEMHMSLAPDQEQNRQLVIEFVNWNRLDQHPAFLALRISYDNGRGRSFSGGIYKFSNVGAEIIETWYD